MVGVYHLLFLLEKSFYVLPLKIFQNQFITQNIIRNLLSRAKLLFLCHDHNQRQHELLLLSLWVITNLQNVIYFSILNRFKSFILI